MIEPKQFHIEIEERVTKTGCTYLEAIIEFQEKSGIEMETVSALVKQNPILKMKLQEEAEAIRMVKPVAKRLSFDP